MTNKKVFLLFPHHLFEDTKALQNADELYLVEEFLFFRQYKFHKQKLLFHRATMKYYEQYLNKKGFTTHYIETTQKESDIRILIETLAQNQTTEIHFYDVSDFWLEKRILESCNQKVIKTIEHKSLLFLNSKSDLAEYFGNKKQYFQTDFYKQQRKKWNILLNPDLSPTGGKWTFDTENRRKYPKNKRPPKVQLPEQNNYYAEAVTYVSNYFSDNYCILTDEIIYPNTHQAAKMWMHQFFEHRFSEFGPYEDAIVQDELILHHSVLSPLLNVGLLQPMQVVKTALEYAQKYEVSLNSLEGFIRQIIGWREFVRGVYVYKGVEERTRNFWKFTTPLPKTFYTADTGIVPLDITLKKVTHTAYCHHIERLMVLGNFMLLTEIETDSVYRWFMEMFIDAYDWVMVPNVYGMSQFADGGIMSTKPYISGSNYLMKMSDYPKGDWQHSWDGLYWNFIDKHWDFFTKNPRLKMMCRLLDKMDAEKRTAHIENAEKVISNLTKNK